MLNASNETDAEDYETISVVSFLQPPVGLVSEIKCYDDRSDGGTRAVKVAVTVAAAEAAAAAAEEAAAAV